MNTTNESNKLLRNKLNLANQATSIGPDQRNSVSVVNEPEDGEPSSLEKLRAHRKYSEYKIDPIDFDLNRKPRWAFEEEKIHEFPSQTQSLKVLVITWNQFGQNPGDITQELLNTEKTDHHIIAISTQECLRSIAKSMFISDSKEEWVSILRKHLVDQYEQVKEITLGAIHLIVFARKELFPFIKEIETAEVRTGFANLLGNKGGIGISFKIKGSSFLFMSSHLNSGQSKTERRNVDFARITTGMSLSLTSSSKLFSNNNLLIIETSLLERFDYIFMAGDLNYRVELDEKETIDLFKAGDYGALLAQDQLLLEMQKPESVFKDFEEGLIRFAPTYKFQKDTQEFNQETLRAPAWTDRILYACRKDRTNLEQKNYDSNRWVFGSDHRPVFSQFLLSVDLTEETEEGEAEVSVSIVKPVVNLLLFILPHFALYACKYIRDRMGSDVF